MSDEVPAVPLPPPNPPRLAQKPMRAISPNAPRHQPRAIDQPNLARRSLTPAPTDGE